jgi:hypothetical protein
MSDDVMRTVMLQNQLLRRRLDMLEEIVFAERPLGGWRLPGGGVSDPAPTDLGRLAATRNLSAAVAELGRRFPPDVNPGDPSPIDTARLGRGVLEQIAAEVLRIRGGVSDPAPDDPRGGGGVRPPIIRFPEVADPAPTDLGRLTRADLEQQIELAQQTRLRLETLEKTLSERLQQVSGGGS